MIGKVAGAIAGLALTRHWLGLLVGALIGHAWDAGWFRRLVRGKRPPGAMFVPLFELCGIVAQADGRVSEAEVAAVEALIARMGLDTVQRNRAVIHFDCGRYGEADADSAIEALRAFATTDPALPLIWLDQLAAIALADGGPEPAEAARGLLASAARRWCVASADLEAIFARRARGDLPPARSRAIPDPWAVLGVSRDADEATCRAAWRRAIARYHPDRARDDSAEAARAAEINAAWDAIRSERGWS
jgi:DnaJ like chaperone protein